MGAGRNLRFAYFLVPLLAAERPEAFASLEGYLDAPPGAWQAATWVSGMGFLALLYGYFGPHASRVARLLPAEPEHRRRTAGALTAALFSMGAASVLAAVLINDGFSLPLMDLFTGGLRDETVKSFSGRGYLSLGFLLLALSVPCAALWHCEAPSRWRLGGALAIGVIAGVLLIGVVGSRILALGIPIAVLVVVHYRVRRLGVLPVVTGGLALAFLGVVVSALRGTGSVADPIAAVGTLGQTLDGFNFLVNALARIDDFSWGTTLVEDLTLTYFPRSLWAGKPLIYGAVSAQEAIAPGLYTDFQGGATFPPGILAEGYVNFGLIGSVVLPFSAAAVLRAVYVRIQSERPAFYVLLLGWLLANLVSLFRGFGLTMPQLIVVAVILSPMLLSGSSRGGVLPGSAGRVTKLRHRVSARRSP